MSDTSIKNFLEQIENFAAENGAWNDSPHRQNNDQVLDHAIGIGARAARFPSSRSLRRAAQSVNLRRCQEEAKCKIEIEGVTRSRQEWAALARMPADVLRKRLVRGMDIKTALTTPYVREQARQKRTHTPEKVKAYIQNLKATGICKDCGTNPHVDAMEFDHVRGQKRFDISRGARKFMEVVVAEIAKCDLVCANCHRKRTAARRLLTSGTP